MQGYIPSTETFSPDQPGLAQHWFVSCLKNHDECASRSIDYQYWHPLRLIDLGASDQPLSARLKIFLDCEGCLDYMTLSHRWGSAEVLKLLKKNSDELVKSIPTKYLPKTFLEAMLVTRSLNIRYLWIDSLCIIQDSPEDWLQQATVMNRVYKNSIITIAATGAKDSLGGLFFKRFLETIEPPLVDLTLTIKTTTGETEEFVPVPRY